MGQQVEPAPTPAPIPGAYWLRHATDAQSHLELLTTLRARILANDRAGAEAAVAELQSKAAREQAPLLAALRAAAIEVRFTFWLTNAISVQAPASLDQDTLRHLPTVAEVLPVQAAEPHIREITGDRFTNADLVQQDVRYSGSGCGVALIDSGVARNMLGTGQPHRVFRRRGTTGHRLAAAYGVAPIGRIPPPPDDYDGHGTAVASVAVGVNWSVPPLSDDGFAYGADLVSYRVVDQTGIAPDDSITTAFQNVVLDRIRFAVRVANCSLVGHPDATHPQQVVLDTLGYFADVLVVTSAGNDGFYPHSGARSHSNCSGLAVGAIWNDQRQIDASSSWGPLPTDGERFWPDLVALGQGQAAKHDDENLVRFILGTSISAPQVAGTAAMLRAIDPTLTAIDTKALILHGVEDIAAANPLYTRFRYGLGMLRTDLVVEGLQRDRLLRGNLRQGSVTQADYTFDLIAGRRYAATMCFARTDPANQANWDNLDLYVYGPDARLRAASETARNLYEKIVFVPRQTGRHRISVVSRNFTSAANIDVPFTLIFGDDRSGAVQKGSFLSMGTGCLGRGEPGANGMIIPPAARTQFGNDNTRVPFAEEPSRLQQVIEHAWLGTATPFTMRRFALRRDNNEANTQNAQVDVDIDLGFTTFAASQMQVSFTGNANLGAMTRVRSGRIDFPGANRGSEVARWDYVISLDVPFHVNTAPGRNLLLDINTRGNDQGNQPFNVWFDAVTDISVGRVYKFAQTNIVFEPSALVLSLMPDNLWPAIPLVDYVGDVQPGQSMTFVVREALPDSAAVMVYGLSRTEWNGIALPIDLTPWGGAGCRLYTDWFVQTPLFVDSVGQRRLQLSLPASAVLSGTVLHSQVIVADRNANPLGIAVSGGTRIVVGG